MAEEKKMEEQIKDITCTKDLKSFQRNRYFYGKLLTVRDFEDEQRYFVEKQRLINRLIHGEGVVCGLKVEDIEGKDGFIHITPGVALDCCGREIVLPEPVEINLSEKISLEDSVPRWVTIRYDACGKEPVPAYTAESSCEETCCYSRIEEGYKIEVLDQKPEECAPVDNEGICDVWSDISKVQVKSAEFTVEKLTPKFVKEKEDLIVRLKIKARKDISDLKILETIQLKDGKLKRVPFTGISLKKGEEKVLTYTIKRKDIAKKSKITGIITVGSNTYEIPSSFFEPWQIDPYNSKANEFVNFWHQECPVSEEKPIILAKIAVTIENGSIKNLEIDNAIVDEEKFYKKLVYSNPRLYQLIKCVENELKAALEKDLPHIKGINWEHDREYIWGIIHSGTARDGTNNTITLADDASGIDNSYNGMQIVVTFKTPIGSLKSQYRIITAYNGTIKKATVDEIWATIPGDDAQYQIIQNEFEEFSDKLDRLEIIFDQDRTIKRETINAKTLNVIGMEYGIGSYGDLQNIEAIMEKRDMPLYFYADTPDNEVHFRILPISYAPSEDKKDIRRTIYKEAINRTAKAMYSSVVAVLSYTWQWIGYRALIRLKGDFVLDTNGNPIDANHLKGETPTGNGTAGGLFESWFDLKIDLNLSRNQIGGVRVAISHLGSNVEVVAEHTHLSKESTQIILDAMVKNKVIYHKEGKYYPLPHPVKTMIVYDGKYNYLKESAEKLKADLGNKGITLEMRSSDELTDEDKKKYEIILNIQNRSFNQPQEKYDYIKRIGQSIL